MLATSPSETLDLSNQFLSQATSSPWEQLTSTASSSSSTASSSQSSENVPRDMLVIPEECCPIFDRKVDNFDNEKTPLSPKLETSKSEEHIGSVLDLVGVDSKNDGEQHLSTENISRESCYLDDVIINGGKETKKCGIKRTLSLKNFCVSSTGSKQQRANSFNRAKSTSFDRSSTHGNVTIQYRKKWKDFSISRDGSR